MADHSQDVRSGPATIPPSKSLVVIGVGGMGLSVAQHLGRDRKVFLADYSAPALEDAQRALESEGYVVSIHKVDISTAESTTKLAQDIAADGEIAAVVHTAGVSAATSATQRVWAVDLCGTANVIDAFASVATPGMAVVCIASMAGHGVANSGLVPQELAQHLAASPADQLLDRPELQHITNGGQAYAFAKYGNILRVQAAAKMYGLKGARINSVSPGIIKTAMSEAELAGEYGAYMKTAVEQSATGRFGAPDDITNAVAFLCSPGSSFITGADLLVDGGVTSSQRWK